MSGVDTNESPSSQGHRGLRGYACEPCVRRKVRCDRLQPCSSCRRRPKDKCIYSTPDPRLAQDQRPVQKRRTGSPQASEQRGRLIVEHSQDRSRYIDEPLLSSINAIVRNDRELLRDASDDEEMAVSDPLSPTSASPGLAGLFGSHASSPRVPLTSLHPAPEQILILWDVFHRNAHPVLMLFAAWQKELEIRAAIADLSQVRARMEVFLFAMYTMALCTLTREESQHIMNEPRSVCLDRYQSACERALSSARILRTSDLLVLQGFVIYLFSIRPRTDPNSLHSLGGLLMRISERIGLHRDGSSLGLSPWETEHRRRLWWQIVKFDHLASQLAGCTPSSMFSDWDTKMPSDMDDKDFKPDMGWVAPRSSGEMMHAMVRYEFVHHFRSIKRPDGTKWGVQWWRSTDATLEEKDEVINGFEKLLQTKYMQFYDPQVPIHLLAAMTIRSAICSMRISTHHHHLRLENNVQPSEQAKETLLHWAFKGLEYHNLCITTDTLRGFVWHTDMYFQWMPFILILTHLCDHVEGPHVEKAWAAVTSVYDLRPDFIPRLRQSLLAAVGHLTLRAWDKREEYLRDKGAAYTEPPKFVQDLRSLKGAPAGNNAPSSISKTSPTANMKTENGEEEATQSLLTQKTYAPFPADVSLPMNMTQINQSNELSTESVDWGLWDNWMWTNEFQTEPVFDLSLFS